MEIKENQSLGSVTEEDSKNWDHPRKKGEILTFVRVRFPGNTKSFPFLVGKRHFNYGQKVVAASDRGMDIGYINSFPYKVSFDESMLPIRSITRAAEEKDFEQQQEVAQKIKKAQTLCENLAAQLKLDMHITHVENIQFGKKIVFYFHAPGRIDFRQLVKDLVSELKVRIELRQISLRDRTAAIGSIGPCGLMTCCSSFLKNYGKVNIKMAKNQNLALAPGKLNGVCGQLKCCLGYEEEVYREKRKELPAINDLVETANGDIGKVSRLHLMPEEFEMLTDQGRVRRYAKDQYERNHDHPKNKAFPENFEHIIIENKQVIGRDLPTSEKEDFVVDNSAFSLDDSSKAEDKKKEKPSSANREETFEEEEEKEEESEEDRLALKKAQSLSLEEQERESQNYANPHSGNTRGGNRPKHGGGRNFKHFPKNNNRGGRYNRFTRNKSRKK